MIKTIRLVVAAAIAGTIGCGVLAPQQAAAASLTQDALVGNWVVNEGACSDPNAEYIRFSQNGAVESARNGRTDAVGFWKLENDKIELNVLAPPSLFDERLKDVKGYAAFDITIAIYNVTSDGFQGVGILGEQIQYGTFSRCKA